MFILSTYRAINLALQNFWRNIWLSAVTITIITLSLISVSFLGVINYLSGQALQLLQNKIDISVYLKPGLKDEVVQNFIKDINTLPGLISVEKVTSAQALDRFKNKHQDNQLISQAILELSANPLGPSIIIKAGNNEYYRRALNLVRQPQYDHLIANTKFDDYERVIKGVTDISNKLTLVGEVVSLVFILIALLVVFNTIRMNIYTHREEIGIMRLVGASTWFIRAPFWVDSVLYAALATLLTAAVFFPLLATLQPYINSLLNGLEADLIKHFTQTSLWFFGGQFLGATILSIVASTVAMRQYLKI